MALSWKPRTGDVKFKRVTKAITCCIADVCRSLGKTALWTAVECNHEGTVRMLIQAGADVHVNRRGDQRLQRYLDDRCTTPRERAMSLLGLTGGIFHIRNPRMHALLTEAGCGQRRGAAAVCASLQAADAGEQAAEACVGGGVAAAACVGGDAAAEVELQRRASREEGGES